MGLKKYEIITVGSDKRVRALRSWAVGDRYVNIGDVGGIVYDEKTLSQDGACWLFRGNFGFPGARIGGDSIVDVGEAALSTTGAPNVDILGSSVVVGSKLQLGSRQTAEDAVVLTAADFEQGGFNALIAGNPLTKVDTTQYVRPKNLFFAGGKTVTLKCEVPGYTITAVALDRDGLVITSTLATATGESVTITVPAGQYFSLMMTKDPVSPADVTVPADATAAQITFTGAYETKLSIIDSRVEINPATSAGTLSLRPGGTYTMSSGAKYPDSVIQNSKVSMMVHATANRLITLMTEFINTNAVIDALGASGLAAVGVYKNVKNLTISGNVSGSSAINIRGAIQATDCDNFAVSPTIFPGLAAAQTAKVPFIFQGCNVPNGWFEHHAQIANTYKNIDFAKASVDLGKTIASGPKLVSSEVEGMYHIHWSVFGAMVESYDSVKSLSVQGGVGSSYGTTIYKDAYLNGLFDFAGTNVFGHKVRSHPLAQVLNVQPRAVQGTFNTVVVGGTITGVVANANCVGIPRRFRLNRRESLFINGVPSGVETQILAVDPNDKIVGVSSWAAGDRTITPYSIHPYAFIQFRKTGDAAITPEDLAGVTVTVYNGCKIVNTGETAVNMKGNIRVEDNATLINSSITGTGYFGGNAVASSLFIAGSVFMKDNAKFIKTEGTNVIRNLRITENGTVNLGDVTWLGVVQVADNAVLSPSAITLTECDIFMSGNASITSSVSIAGALRMEENASIEANTTVIGAITLSGNYKGNIVKTWTGKRTITDVNEPEYDNNVKSKYDL